MKKETKRKVVEHLSAIETRLDELITLYEARIECSREAQARREAS
jgi:hypothetical protein